MARGGGGTYPGCPGSQVQLLRRNADSDSDPLQERQRHRRGVGQRLARGQLREHLFGLVEDVRATRELLLDIYAHHPC